MALLGVLPIVVLSVPNPVQAATINANFDGVWHLVTDDDSTGVLTITNENPTTGTFGGTAVVSGAAEGISISETDTVSQGQVTGDSFTMTWASADLVVGQNGTQTEYSGTIDGNTMTIVPTGIQVWRDGRTVSASISGDGTGTRVTYTLSGTVEAVACGLDATACTVPPQPVAGITVTASSDSGGDSTTTGSDGTYQLNLPPGSYTVTPSSSGREFKPVSSDVDLEADTPGVDFETCAMASATSDLSGPGLPGYRLDATSASTVAPCPRPTSMTLSCEVPTLPISITVVVVSQVCEVTVIDEGASPRQSPTGDVNIGVTPAGAANILSGSSVLHADGVDAGNGCTQLEPTDVVGVSQCQFIEHPTALALSPSSIHLTLGACYFPDDSGTFAKSCAAPLSLTYSPRISPAAKLTATHVAFSLGSTGTVLGAAGHFAGLVGVPLTSLGYVAGLAAIPFGTMALKADPPDPNYQQVFKPRLVKAQTTHTASAAFDAAMDTFSQTESTLESWAGAEWNALNRSIIASAKKNRPAYSTQMLAASKDESEMADLMAKLPAELEMVKDAAPPSDLQLSVDLTSSQFDSLKASLAKPSAAEKKLAESVGVPTSLVTSEAARDSKDLTLTQVNGNAFDELTNAVMEEANQAPFLNTVSADQAKIGDAFKPFKKLKSRKGSLKHS